MYQPISSARRHSRRRALIGSLVGLALFGVSAAPARATMYQQVVPYSGSEVLPTFDDCGPTVSHTAVYSGRFMIRTGKGDLDGAFFVHDVFSYTETYTNITEGSEHKWFTVSGSYLTQDVRATHIDGTIFQFVSHQVGQPSVVRNMDGQVVLRDRGAITTTYVFDTGSPGPGGIRGEDISVRISGPHPGFFLDPAAQCAGLLSLIG